ncbi:MAG TPA: SIR2 family protein [Steroidobacteraceae bacterium]|nr:SIR2 family protein [Steroidobacteraceae bacterium]
MHGHRDNPGFGILCDAVAYRRLVVVTGSGVSVGLAKPGSDPTTLPTWHSVLTQLQDRFASRLGAVAPDVDLLLSAQPRTSDYLIEAATLIRETVGVGDYRDAVVQLTTAADDARTPLHDLIEDLEPLGIITFNYDLGHENAYRARRHDRHRMHRAIYSDERKLRAVLAEEFRSRFLLKAHGCISRPKTIVLDRASYREVMARQLGYRAFAHHVLARFSALIVGFGLNDPDFGDLLQSFEANFGGGVGEHVYIWKRGQREDEEARALVLRRRYGLVCLFVDSFDDVRTVISDARTHMGAELRRTITATLKRSADVEEFRQLRRKAHIELGRLSVAGARVAATALTSVVNDDAEPVLIRAEAAYSLGKIRPTTPGVADFLLGSIRTGTPPPIVTSSLAALLQMDPPVDDQLAIWTARAASLESACAEADRLSGDPESRHPPRARKYLEALIARWTATSS